ncbi:unnamed protein product [Auanema sp. JU1783]|nr:unnamed protein product [Auanema sp. JU1783]
MDLPEAVTNKLIELDGENRQLKLDIARKDSAIRNRDETLVELEEENRKLLERNSELLKTSKDTSAYESKIVYLRGQFDDANDQIVHLKTKCKQLEDALKEQSDVQEIYRPIRTPTPPPLRNIEDEEEYIRLREELDDTKIDLSCCIEKLRYSEEEHSQTKRLVEDLYEEIKELQRSLKEMREEKAELEAKLCETENNLPFASKGNSMFGEFVHERKVLEADLKKLFNQCEGLKKENYNLTNELEEARLLALRRTGAATVVRCQCEDMRVELMRARNKIDASESRIQSLNNEKLRMVEGLKGPSIDSMLRAQFSSLKAELEFSKRQNAELLKERNLLLDDRNLVKANLRRAENAEKIAKEDVAALTSQIQLMKQRRNEEQGLIDSTTVQNLAVEKITKLIAPPAAILNSMIHSTPVRKDLTGFKTPLPPSMTKGDESMRITPNMTSPKSSVRKSNMLGNVTLSDRAENRREITTATERRLQRQKFQGPRRAVPTVKPPCNLATFRMVVGTPKGVSTPSEATAKADETSTMTDETSTMTDHQLHQPDENMEV